MGWTMTLKDDFGVIAWTRRAGNYLILFFLLSLFSIPVQSDIVFPKDHHFSWKTGKMSYFFHYKCVNQCSFMTIKILLTQDKYLSSLEQNHNHWM